MSAIRTQLRSGPQPESDRDSAGGAVLLDGISIVVPARNEELSLGAVLAEAVSFGDEVIVVDGRSTDQTTKIARQFGARVVVDNGKGKGDAIRVGARAARYSITVFMDADGSHNPVDIPRLTGPIEANEADLVVGSRGRGGSDELHGDIEKLLRLLGSDLILIAINLRWKQTLTDSQNGFRAIRTNVIHSLGLTENITTIEQEMMMKCLKKGYRVAEVPTHEYARKHGQSCIRLRKVWLRYIYCFVKNIF